MENEKKAWIARWRNQSGSPKQPSFEDCIIEGQPDHAAAMAAAIAKGSSYKDFVLESVKPVIA